LQTALPRFLLASGCDKNRRDACSPFSGVFENQDAAIIEGDFLGAPCRALIDAVWVGIGWIPGTVEPIEVGFVIGDPLFNRLPGRLDRLHGFDIKGRRRWTSKLDDALPKTVEAEEEFDFLAADDLADGLHGAFAARTLEWVAAPDFQNEVAPEGPHVVGGLFGRWWNEENFRCQRFFERGRGFRRADDAVGDERGLASGFVGVEAVVADRLLALGWDVEQSGGDEVGGFEDLEVALGVVVALGAVDDGLGGGVPGDFLEGEGMT